MLLARGHAFPRRNGNLYASSSGFVAGHEMILTNKEQPCHYLAGRQFATAQK